MDAPRYPCQPIHSLKALSLALGEPVALLENLAKRGANLYRSVPQKKKDGTTRDTYDAYEPLKRIQRKIVDRLLARVSFPEYLHGGIKDPSAPRSIYSNANPHGHARHLVLQDISDFFPSISSDHVYQVFRELFGFGDDVSRCLALLTTRQGAVPQGASTSSYLANLLFWDIEPAVVAQLDSQGLRYSRFADDITISSAHELNSSQLREVIALVTNMLTAKGCHQKRSKLHVRKRGQTIRGKDGFVPLTVTGLTVFNSVPGITKAERKNIRAAVREVEEKAALGTPWLELEPLCRKVMGRIGRLIACKHPDGQRLKERVMALKGNAVTAPVTSQSTS